MNNLPDAYGRDFGSRGKLQNVDDCRDTLIAAMGNGGGNVPIVEEPFIVASRGRNPENPSDRTVGSPTEQRLEPNSQGIANTLTTVLKDNYVAEPQPQLRIRKLTPKECYCLMGFSDETFSKAEQVCSNTQLYKQAGNSIVVDVLEHLFENLRVYLT
jgi:DNA (cytosine-5)-methyltransferase 1